MKEFSVFGFVSVLTLLASVGVGHVSDVAYYNLAIVHVGRRLYGVNWP